MILRALSLILLTWVLFVACLFGLCYCSSHGWAQVPQTGAGAGASVSYVGPGDVVPATAFYGLRAYSAAYAASQGPAVAVKRTNDNTTCTFNVASNGGFGVTASGCTPGTGLTFNQFAAHGSCTGSISGTTLTCSSATATPSANDTLSGTGIHIAVIVASCGAFTSGSGTCSLSTVGGQTIPTIGSETISYNYLSTVTSWTDQTGNLNTMAQATAANQPGFIFPCLNSLPCVFAGAGSGGLDYMTSTGGSLSQPYTISAVSSRTAATTTLQFMSVFGGSLQVATGYAGSTNTGRLQAGSITTATASDQVLHSFQYVLNSGTDTFNVDNTLTSVAAGTNAIPGGWDLMGNGTSSTMVGPLFEFGIFSIAFSTTQQTAMCHNHFLYYATGVSC